MDNPKFSVGDEVVLLENIGSSWKAGLKCKVARYSTRPVDFNDVDTPHYWIFPVEGELKDEFFVYPCEIDYFWYKQEVVDLKEWL